MELYVDLMRTNPKITDEERNMSGKKLGEVILKSLLLR